MNNNLIKTGIDYSKKTKGFDKILFKNDIVDLKTKQLTTLLINLGKNLFDKTNFDMKNCYFDYIRNDILADMIKSFDFENKLIIQEYIKDWSEQNILPFNESQMSLYEFASICIRLYLLMKTNEFIDNKINDNRIYAKYSSDDINKFNRDKYFYIFNDYYIEDLDETEREHFNINSSNIKYNIEYSKLKEYVFRLYNDMNKTYNLIQIAQMVYFDKKTKKGKIIKYHKSPLSAVFTYIGTRFCNNDKNITECWHCGYYMEVENDNTHYHDDCYFEHERLRKKNR